MLVRIAVDHETNPPGTKIAFRVKKYGRSLTRRHEFRAKFLYLNTLIFKKS